MEEAWAAGREVLEPNTEPVDWLFTVVIAGELNPKILFPMLPTASDELPKAVLLTLPKPTSCLILVCNGSEAEDVTGKSVVTTGEDPNLNKDGAGDEDADAMEEEEPVLQDAFATGTLVVLLELVKAAAAVLLLLAPGVEKLNVFWLEKIFGTEVGMVEENDVFEAGVPLF